LPPIAPIIAWTVSAVGAVVAARALVREWRRVNAILHRREAPVDEAAGKDLPTLRRDPRTGIYRPD